ncbi:MAG: phosphoenolpyruvate--protein phosphotransferase [Candidatus Krumholzibacteria bacterium]
METRKVSDGRQAAEGVSPAEGGREEIVRHGISAAPGIVIGPAFVMRPEIFSVPNTTVPPAEREKQIASFKHALAETRKELIQIQADMSERLGEDHARIFEAHLLILDDVMVVGDTEALIRSENRNAAWAFQKVISNILSGFEDIEDEYLRDRFTDILDVKKRVIGKLLGKQKRKLIDPSEPSVVFARDLSPSETAQFDRKKVLGYATDRGGRTSHTAILARSQGVAAVVGLEDLSARVRSGDPVVLDGNAGTVVIHPSHSTLDNYHREIKQYKKLEKELLKLTGYPAETLDNRNIQLKANIDLPDEIESAVAYGAQGVGLFRTEYFFIAQDKLPSEEEQYQIYRSVLEHMGDNPVTIRVLDIGGDKIADYLHSSPELNPFMGWRGIRFLLTRKDIFKTQLRAIYRASAHGSVKILLPLIVEVDEVKKAKQICAEVREQLRSNRFRIDDNVEIGIMVETPSAVLLADALAKEVDFFSIGTNDLIQYTMAVDRGNSKISHLYQHLHPSIIRFLKMTVDAARKHKIPVSICGEMAVDPMSTVVLIGLQLDEFSCSPNMMPEVKKIIRSVTYDECKMLVKRILKYVTTEQIERDVTRLLRERCPDLAMFHE